MTDFLRTISAALVHPKIFSSKSHRPFFIYSYPRLTGPLKNKGRFTVFTTSSVRCSKLKDFCVMLMLAKTRGSSIACNETAQKRGAWIDGLAGLTVQAESVYLSLVTLWVAPSQ